jgi:hypothetical protein
LVDESSSLVGQASPWRHVPAGDSLENFMKYMAGYKPALLYLQDFAFPIQTVITFENCLVMKRGKRSPPIGGGLYHVLPTQTERRLIRAGLLRTYQLANRSMVL